MVAENTDDSTTADGTEQTLATISCIEERRRGGEQKT